MRKKWILITIISVVVVALASISGVLVLKLRHKHSLDDAKVYHVYNNYIYYTKQCSKDKHAERFETDQTLIQVIDNIGVNDKIVLEENISLSNSIKIKSYTAQAENAAKNIVINIDLNNKTINSMFDLDGMYGSIEFNISNGTIASNVQNAIKLGGEYGKVEVNIINVECCSVGEKNTPLYIENIDKASVNAVNSKFISKNEAVFAEDYGVGVFINSKGNFKFQNCLLEGGDGLHVKNGCVTLNGCELRNKCLTAKDYQSTNLGFNAVGASLVAVCYTSDMGTTNFEITIKDCSMTTLNSNRVMYVYADSMDGYEAVVNPESFIKIESCVFDENPSEFYYYDKVLYANGSSPVNNSLGYWVYGIK